VFTPRGLMPGGGMSVEKILLGVTVREIHYVDDPAISTASHPVYALLVSREIDVNQSALMDDGLTPEQRQEVKNEKEHKRMAKQVEADLGGFDVEQEWVEEIERDDCFEIEKRYGGAPPMPQSKYEVWVSNMQFQLLEILQVFSFSRYLRRTNFFL
jgi:cleavage and polyadenylation specificity factor subunit 1